MPRLHPPALVEETLRLLSRQVHKDEFCLDATVGTGGHAEAWLQANEHVVLVGLDRDAESLYVAAERLEEFAGRVILVKSNFEDAVRVLDKLGIGELGGALFDVGVSLFQLDHTQRGLSFSREGPLDMRADRSLPASVGHMVNELSRGELSDLLWRYGGERWSRRIAENIVRHRAKHRVTTTAELAAIVEKAIPGQAKQRGKTSPSTKSFAALRTALNQELSALEHALHIVAPLLAPAARLVVLCYQGNENRTVRSTLRSLSSTPSGSHRVHPSGRGQPLLRPVWCRLIRPTLEEVRRNPRSRSVFLHAYERT